MVFVSRKAEQPDTESFYFLFTARVLLAVPLFDQSCIWLSLWLHVEMSVLCCGWIRHCLENTAAKKTPAELQSVPEICRLPHADHQIFPDKATPIYWVAVGRLLLSCTSRTSRYLMAVPRCPLFFTCRYTAVAMPLLYNTRYSSRRRVAVMIAVVWFLSFAISCPLLFGLNNTGKPSP